MSHTPCDHDFSEIPGVGTCCGACGYIKPEPDARLPAAEARAEALASAIRAIEEKRKPPMDNYEQITRLNCGVMEQKLAVDEEMVTALRKRLRPSADLQRVSQFLGAASLLLEEAARVCRFVSPEQ